MPEESTDVLAFLSDESIVVASRTGTEWSTYGANEDSDSLGYTRLGRITYVIAEVSHWAPLPEPPEVSPAPILGRAEPAPPVKGRVEFVAERIVSAEEVDGLRPDDVVVINGIRFRRDG